MLHIITVTIYSGCAVRFVDLRCVKKCVEPLESVDNNLSTHNMSKKGGLACFRHIAQKTHDVSTAVYAHLSRYNIL